MKASRAVSRSGPFWRVTSTLERAIYRRFFSVGSIDPSVSKTHPNTDAREKNANDICLRRLVVGLGNPGDKFKQTRHNVGNMVCSYFVNEYTQQLHMSESISTQWKTMKSVPGDVARCVLQFQHPSTQFPHRTHDLTDLRSERRYSKTLDEGCIYPNIEAHFLLPSTYMNLSGTPVRNYLTQERFRLKNNAIATNRRDELLVIADELDLPFGTIRFKPKGGSGGQNGLKHVIKCVGTEKFARMRVGIGPPDSERSNVSQSVGDAASYVLGKFNSGEQDRLNALMRYSSELLRVYFHRGFTEAASIANSSDLDEFLKIDLTKKYN